MMADRCIIGGDLRTGGPALCGQVLDQLLPRRFGLQVPPPVCSRLLLRGLDVAGRRAVRPKV